MGTTSFARPLIVRLLIPRTRRYPDQSIDLVPMYIVGVTGDAYAMVGVTVDVYAMVGVIVMVGIHVFGESPFGQSTIGEKT